MDDVHKNTRRKKVSSLSDDVYTRIKADIFDFKLMPGERFTETECAELYQVSRTPVRQALLALQQEGFVELASRVGWQVRPLDLNYYQQLYDVRIVLEKEAIRIISQKQPEHNAILLELKRIWMVPSEEFLSDFRQVVMNDEDFHQQLIVATGNAEMVRMHKEITEKIRIIRRLDFTKPDRIKLTYFEHQKILSLIFSGLMDDAISSITHHIERSRNEVEKITLQMISQTY